METIIKNEIREITFPETVFLTKRAIIPFDGLSAFFSASYAELYALIQKLGIESTNPPCAIYYAINESAMETDLAAAVPVEGNLPEFKDYDQVLIPESRVVATTHYGSYDDVGGAYEIIENYCAEKNLKRGLIIEEYLTDPSIEKDPTKWITNIYCIINKS
jgi:effector-binding domain-containing protein